MILMAWKGGCGMNQTDTKMVPPYLSYRTFRTFTDSLRQGIPARVDRTLMRNLSGQIQTQLLAALRYLQLIQGEDIPTDKMARLVIAEGKEREAALRAIIESAYPFFAEPNFNLAGTTPGQLDNYFKAQGASGDTTRKCVAFFLQAVEDAGMSTSPYLRKARQGESNGGRGRKAPPAVRAKTRTATTPPATTQPPAEQPPATISWEQMLLSKFPSFDPEWPDDVKSKWFDAFDKLMAKKPMDS
jgi:hypothetical protein